MYVVFTYENLIISGQRKILTLNFTMFSESLLTTTLTATLI